jgi:hypothetical protein
MCGQAFGLQNFRMIGIVMQWVILIDFCIAVPILLIWLHISPLLIALGQDPRIADLAGTFLLWCSPQLLLTAVGVSVEKFQTSQVRVPCCLSDLRLSFAQCIWDCTRCQAKDCCLHCCLFNVQ